MPRSLLTPSIPMWAVRMHPGVPCSEKKQKKPCNIMRASPQAELQGGKNKKQKTLWDVYERPWERNQSLWREQFMSNMRLWLTSPILQRVFLRLHALILGATTHPSVCSGSRQVQFIILLTSRLFQVFFYIRMKIVCDTVWCANHFLKWQEHFVLCCCFSMTYNVSSHLLTL